MPEARSSWTRLTLATVLTLALAGCGSKGDDAGNTLGNIFAYNTTKPPALPANHKTMEVDCPIVQVVEGQGGYRVYSGATQSNDTVRQQFSLGDMSRDCVADETGLNIRIGIAGYVLLGPVGAPGSFSVPVKIVVRRESDKQPAAIRTYKIAATVPPGETQASFSMVTEPINVPYISAQADSDYSIYIGIDQGGASARPEKVARKRRAR